jgi:ribosomal protein S18 acetylase RimI-like enzyme
MMLKPFSLVEMNYAEIQQYIEFSQREYAQGMLDQGEYPDYDTALRAARNEVLYYYNHKVEGEFHHAYHIINTLTNEKTGIFAFSILRRRTDKQPFVFVDYVSVFPQYRRLGYAKFAMNWLEHWAREHHIDTIDLNVMMHKKGAVDLYKTIGYEIFQERALGLSKVPGRFDMRKVLPST